MAGETLRTGTQLLAETPDNTAGLIDAVNLRNTIVSEAAGIAFLEDDNATFPITIIDGVWVDINASITPAPQLASNFAFQFDSNNAILPDYSGITVPAGVQRLTQITTFILAVKAGGGTASYDYQHFLGGAPVGNPLRIEHTAVQQLVTGTTEILYEPALGQTISARIMGVGTADQITINDMRQRVMSVLI
jgi:hypothetical protein